VPTARARRGVAAEPAAVWALAGDPNQLPRWWPLVVRVEGVSGRGFTTVSLSKRGREVRADQRVVADVRPRRRAWALEVAGTPFEAVFSASETELRLSPQEGGGTVVELELRQRLRGGSRVMGPLVRHASRRQLRQALDGLEQALAGAGT
jgi:uncharacterized protein YndB with AHSA1/START domain